MKKSLILVLILFCLNLLAAFNAPALAATSCGGLGTHSQCGETVGCGTDEICIVGWGFNNGKCESTAAGATYEGQCANRDAAKSEVCGYTNSTNQWCGVSGGCQAGYMCDANAKKCVAQSACQNMANEYNKQCGGFSTVNKCGNEGMCATGYRCVDAPEAVSPFGYACLDQQDNSGQKCPGSPSTGGGGQVTLLCGGTHTDNTAVCNCTGAPNTPIQNPSASVAAESYCCGWIGSDGKCTNTKPVQQGNPPPADGSTPTDGSTTDTGTDPTADNYNIFEAPNSEDFASLNPLALFGKKNINDQYFTSPAGIISRVLLFAFPIAGLILFVMLVWAGFQILAGASQGSKSIEAGKQRATTAIVGFILLFVAYWIMQIIEIVFSIQIL